LKPVPVVLEVKPKKDNESSVIKKEIKMVVDKNQLKQLKVTDVNSEKYLLFLNESLLKYEINTPLRISHFLSQTLHESGMFKYSEELASGEAYEGRTDLGNTQPGDGVFFKGRGLIQVTGRNNYKKYGDYVGIDFISEPTKLAEPKYAVDSAGWYWITKVVVGKNLNNFADEDFATLITYLINGGYNGTGHRLGLLKKCYVVFGVPNNEDRLRSHFEYMKKNLINENRKPSEKAMLKAYPDLPSIQKLESEVYSY